MGYVCNVLRKAIGDLTALYFLLSNLEEETKEKIIVDDNVFNNDFTGGKGGEEVPPKYADGCFRQMRKSGLLQYRFMFKGKQCQVYGYSKQDCWQKREDYARDIVIPIAEKKEIVLTYKKWIDIWLKEKEPDCKIGYYNSIRMYLKNDILPKIGGMKLSEITTSCLQNFLMGVKQDNKRTKIAAIMSESIRRAYELQKIPFNVFLAVRFKKYESPHKLALTHAEQIKLLDNVSDNKLYVITKLLLLTGLRQGEALALTADDIHEDGIRVNKALSKDEGITTPKTKSSVRTVPINKELYAILTPYTNGGRVFDYKNDYLHRYYSMLFKRLKINATGHSLRHTFITNAYEVGILAHIVQRWAGHAKAEQADTYLDLRYSKDFIETDIVKYMRDLKDKYVPKV